MTGPIVKVGLIQVRHCGDDDLNVGRTVEAVGRAAGDGARIICLQELFRGPYFCQTHDINNFDRAEPLDGPTVTLMRAEAARHKAVLVIPFYEKAAPGVYFNSAVVAGPDGAVLGHYRKMHIPHDPLFYEKYYFTPGDLGFQAVETPFGRIGVLICWDQWFPEAARLTALQGAQILFHPTAIGWHPREKDEFGAAQRDAWITAQRAHAIANGVFVAAPNRVGLEASAGGGIEFWGSSFVADPFGRMLATAPDDAETNLVVDCDLGLIEETRRNWPFLRDRRIDAYGGILQRIGGQHGG